MPLLLAVKMLQYELKVKGEYVRKSDTDVEKQYADQHQNILNEICEFLDFASVLSSSCINAMLSLMMKIIYEKGAIEKDKGWDFRYPMLAIA